MSMTDVEIWETIQMCVRHVDRKEPHSTTYPGPEVLAFCDARVAEASAANQEPQAIAEPKDDATLARLGALETAATHMGHRAADLEHDMKRLFEYVSAHNHTTNHPHGLGPPETTSVTPPYTHEPVVRYERKEPLFPSQYAQEESQR